MIIDCAHYRDGHRQEEGPVSLEEAAARCEQGGFVWLGLFEPGPDELAEVQAAFGLHELAVEDAQNFHLRPKVELYEGGIRLVILRTARYDDEDEEVDFGKISVFLAPTFVITVRQGVGSELRGARQRLEQRPELLTAGSSSALWAILDQVVDGYAPVVAGLEHDIDQIEATVFSGTVAPTERIYSLRREATDFYRAVHPLLGVVGTIERSMAAPELQPYLRDVKDHVLLVDEEVAAQRDLLGTVLEANMAVISVEQTKVSVQQNATIEQLTILATVFLPLTFVTGFFGQNFGWLVAAHREPGRVRLLRHRRPGRAAGAAVPVAQVAPGSSRRLAPGAEVERLTAAIPPRDEPRESCVFTAPGEPVEVTDVDLDAAGPGRGHGQDRGRRGLPQRPARAPRRMAGAGPAGHGSRRIRRGHAGRARASPGWLRATTWCCPGSRRAGSAATAAPAAEARCEVAATVVAAGGVLSDGTSRLSLRGRRICTTWASRPSPSTPSCRRRARSRSATTRRWT